MEGFGIGLLHPLVTAHHALLLLALGALAGQQAAVDLKWPMLLFVPVSGLALLLTTRMVVPEGLQCVILGAALVLALLLAASAPVPKVALAPSFALTAWALGLDSGVQAGAGIAATATTLVAIWVSLGLCIMNIAYYSAVIPQRQWTRIGIRIAGSWIAAICMLMLVFALRRGGLAGA